MLFVICDRFCQPRQPKKRCLTDFFVSCIAITMKSPNWLKSYVESLVIQPGGRYRSDCPVCGKPNTFSVTDGGLERMWYCFHADCHVSGRTGLTLTRDKARTAFASKVAERIQQPVGDFEIPNTFVSLSRNLDAESYVRRVGAYDAYLSGLADIRYDVKRNRVAYLIKDGRKIVDAAGRSLANVKPKWYRYGNSGHPYICGNNTAAVFLVEDAASACSVSGIVTGAALLGTNLVDSYIRTITNYEKVYVALDKDATSTALDIVKRLNGKVATKLVVLPKDLKDMGKDERDDFIRSKLT